MDAETRRLVRARAQNRCEYCGLHQDDSPLIPLQVEHVLPKKHAGSDDFENLAIACIDCNLHKGTNIAGLDPETRKLTPLYNPRIQDWDEHFVWIEAEIHGLTPTGRVTVQVLDLNGADRIELRLFGRGE